MGAKKTKTKKKKSSFFLLQLAENLQMEDLNQYPKKEDKKLPS